MSRAGSLEWSDPDGMQVYGVESFEIWCTPLMEGDKILVELKLTDKTSLRVRLNVTDAQWRRQESGADHVAVPREQGEQSRDG